LSQSLFEWFFARSLGEWIVFSLLGNILIFLASVGLCQWLWTHFQKQPLIAAQKPISRRDIGMSVVAVVLNSAVAVLGFVMWKAGLIRLTQPGWLRTLLDVLLFLLAMDLGMYVFHRIAHLPLLFELLHAPHHLHVRTNALSLFVLHPAEVLGFGALMIAVMMLLPLSGVAVLVYLALNVLWGTLGHAGVEPLPRALFRLPVLGALGSGTFHAQHHHNPSRNFGFYTVLWDRLFGSIDPDYPQWLRSGPQVPD
jgi:sterol desaturase/sphingolipid hydroxylase (fatty acid hydroxylase superfamily)